MTFMKAMPMWFVLFLLWLVVATVCTFVQAIPVYYLWNWLMPDIFKISVITFWQAWGISLLAAIFLKSSLPDVKLS